MMTGTTASENIRTARLKSTLREPGKDQPQRHGAQTGYHPWLRPSLAWARSSPLSDDEELFDNVPV